jgi:CHAT domain-containing protein
MSKLNSLYNTLQKNFPVFYNSKINQFIPSIREVQKTLNKTQSILQFSVNKNDLYTLLIMESEVSFRKIDSAEILNLNLSKLHQELSNSNSTTLNAEEYNKISFKLYSLLFKDIEKYLKDIKELIIIPDEDINLIPFEALTYSDESDNKSILSFKNLKFLINKFQITYAPALRIYHTNRFNKFPEKPKILVYAYETQTGQLPYSYKELEAIKNVFNENSTIINGENCTKLHFFNNYDKYDVIHFSLHASSSPHDRQDNKIFFSLKKDTLFGFELLKQPINTKLVVLSACETAKGKIITGEGAFSLSRYFLQSGVNNVIASLWKIDDASSSAIVSNFYKNIPKESSLASALHKSKKRFIEKANALSSHPKFWSGLIFID